MLAQVHVGHAGDHPDAEPLRGLEDSLVVVGGAEIEDCGGSPAQKLGDAQLRRGFDAVAVESRLERPGAFAEPLEKLELVGLVAEEGLNHVHVALDESGKNRSPPGVEDPPFIDVTRIAIL